MKSSFNILSATAGDLQRMLTAKSIRSVDIVDSYFAQIEKHNDYLHAVLETAPTARAAAEKLDQERLEGKVRGPLHGIPVLLKGNIATDPELGLKTSAGSYGLVASVPKGNAKIVDQLIAAGLIILGKANLSELSGFKFVTKSFCLSASTDERSTDKFRGAGMQPGWSAIGGQTQSAYVRGGVVPDGTILGHSSPGGSSTGCAVGVSAGFAPLSVGTETDGSLITPANRAALFAMRPTQGLVSKYRIIPISDTVDTPGPITKSVEDLAHMLDVLINPKHSSKPKDGYASFMAKTWDGLRIGFLDPEEFFFAPDVVKPDEGATKQMVTEIRAAYAKIRGLAANVHENISYVTLDDLEHEGVDILSKLHANDFKLDFEAYLGDLQETKIHSIEELIEFNKENSEKELPAYSPNQARLEKALTSGGKMDEEERLSLIQWMRNAGGPNGIDHYLQKYDVDVIIGPTDCECTEPAATAGYPLATMPLSYLELNGRPFGLSVVASAHQESKLIHVLSAFEATFPPRSPPPMLQT